MSTMSMFLKKHKKVRENTRYPATASLCGEDGKPLMWEIRPVSTRENERIQDECTTEIAVKGKPGMFRHKIDTNAYLAKLLSSAVVFPDLFNAELQLSYGAANPEELLREMLDNPKEYNDFTVFVQNYNGFDVTVTEEIEEAKN